MFKRAIVIMLFSYIAFIGTSILIQLNILTIEQVHALYIAIILTLILLRILIPIIRYITKGLLK